jgi:hypothetical protein
MPPGDRLGGSERPREVEQMTLFTVQVELGPETRAMVERIATQLVMRFEVGPVELGPKTREMFRGLTPAKREGDEGLLRKAAEAARGR